MIIPKNKKELQELLNTGFGFDVIEIREIRDLSNFFSGSKLSSFKNFQALNFWQVDHLKNVAGMFAGADLSGLDLSNWRLDNCLNCEAMFEEASEINFSFSSWALPQCRNITDMFSGCDLSPDDLPPVCQDGAFMLIKQAAPALLGNERITAVPNSKVADEILRLKKAFDIHRQLFPDSEIKYRFELYDSYSSLFLLQETKLIVLSDLKFIFSQRAYPKLKQLYSQNKIYRSLNDFMLGDPL